MSRYPKFQAAAVIVAAFFGLVACESMLDTEPRQSVSPEVALSNLSGAQAIMVSAYSRLQALAYYGQALQITPDVMADLAQISNTPSGRMRNQAANQPTAILGQWGAYSGINDVNYIIDGIEALDAPQATRERLKGEALFVRALNYFNLVRAHGYEPNMAVNGFDLGVIIRDKPTKDVADADFRARSTVTEVYQFIERDLKEAITLLTGKNNSVYYGNRAAAEGLLARVYLYWQRWADAESYATQAMANTSARLTTPSNYVAAWTTYPNPEALFELNVNQNTESLGTNEALTSLLTPRSWMDVVISPEALSKFTTEDIRSSFIVRITAGTNNGLSYYDKYKGSKGNFADNLPVLRYSEVLLIRAEARLEQNKLADALADLNTLRAGRNVEALSSTDKAEILGFIFDERIREFLFEGHRWYDLKRRGMVIPKPAASGLQPLQLDDYRRIAPLPSAQVDLNPLLVQNPGY